MSYYLRQVERPPEPEPFVSPRYCECGLTLVGANESEMAAQWYGHLLEVVQNDPDADAAHSMVAW